MESSQETVLVTGASGLIGSHILSLLKPSNARVIAVCRHIPADADKRFEWVACDILDITAVENLFRNADKIYHCAALVSLEPKRRKELLQINVEGTANVVNAALACGAGKLLHVSSVAAIGESNGEDKMISENSAWKDSDASPYGLSKHLAEMEVWRGFTEGLPSAIINPSAVLGCADWNNGSSEIFKTSYDGIAWYTPGAHGFVDVQDVAKIAVMLMNSDVSGQRFIVSGANISYREVFIKIANAFGKKPPHRKVNKFLCELVWRASYLQGKISGKPSVLNKYSARTAMTTVQFDNSKLLQYFPDFRYTDIDESIRRICEEYKEKYRL